MLREGVIREKILLGQMLLLALALAISASVAYSQDDEKAPPEDDITVQEGDNIPEPKSPIAPEKKSAKKSRFTSDESEVKADRRDVLLTTGEDKVVDLDFDILDRNRDVSIGNRKIVEVVPVGIGDQRRQIIFKPLTPGTTNVTVRDAEGTIKLVFHVRVSGSNLLKKAAELRDLLKDIDGINIRILGNKIVIDGEVLVPNDYGRIFSVVSDAAYGENVLSLVTLSGIALQLLSKKIQQDINAFAPSVTARVVNSQIWLEGTVDNAEQAKRAVRVAELYVPEVKPVDLIEKDPNAKRFPARAIIQEFLVINPPPPRKADKLVRVTFHYVELSKDYNKLFGFKWQPGFTANPQVTIGTASSGSTGASTPGFTATISSLFPKLQSAQNAGFARILREGTVIVRSGLEATLKDDQEIPFTVIAPNGQPATDKASVGLELAVTPQILGQTEDIELDVKMEQKVNTGRTNNGAPIVANHRVTTKLYVKSMESAALAGVQGQDIQTSFNKDDPNQGSFGPQTDPLFTLLRSKSYVKKKSRFVIFVTPQIVENASDASKDLKNNFRVRVN